MKQFLISLGLLTVVSTGVNADTANSLKLNDLKGRYALDCTNQKAHNLSYLIGDKSIHRLISAKIKSGTYKYKFLHGVNVEENYKYKFSVAYRGYSVDFFTKDEESWIKVRNTGVINYFGPKTDQYLQQCKTEEIGAIEAF